MAGVLALLWYGAGDSLLDEPLVVCGTCAMSRKTVQNCGRAFWDRYELPLSESSGSNKGGGKRQDEAGDKEDRGETERERAFREKREKKQRESRGKDGGLLKMSEDLKGKDLYDLLEVEAGCSVEDIKKQYRKLVLVHHPDKMTDPTEEQKQHFLLIQEAFEIISDPERKRRYESMLDFDDAIPTGFPKGRYAGMDFFEVFRPVFKRNARWSARPKVPDLGDESTDIEAVKSFYDFWYGFESWRDPLAIAEKEEYELHALDEAECREEKRWMERENAKIAKRIAQAERERISDLVKAAERNDPRMIAYKEKVKQEKEEEKRRRAAAAQAEKDKKEAEARALREKEEEARRIEEAKRQEEKKKREEQKNALKNARQRLRKLHQNAEPLVRHAVHADQLQEVCLRLETEELHTFCASLEGIIEKDAEKSIELLHAEIVKCGATPISDASVDPKGGNSGASTISPEDSNEEGSEDDTPVKTIRELTPEELEAERLRQLAEEAAERERAEKRAEEKRKKQEAQRKEDEKRQAELRKQEKKEREKVAKEKAKEEKKLEQAAKQAEEQKAKQQRQAEEQRAAALAEEAERRQQHEEQLVARAFETDRCKRVAVLEAYDGGLLEQALRGTLLQEGAEQPNARLRLALRLLAARLPTAVVSKDAAAEQARKEAEELCVDLASACLAAEGGADAAPEDARARLAGAVGVAVRPPRDGAPELSKEAKAVVKKQRTRVRAAVLSLLRALEAAEPALPMAKPKPAGTSPPPREVVADGVEFVVGEDGVIFESAHTYDELGVATTGTAVLSAGPAEEVEGCVMVPIRPRGAVELRILRAVAGSAAASAQAAGAKAPKEAGQKKGKAQGGAGGGAKAAPAKAPAEVELDGSLRELVRLAGTNADLAEDELRRAFFGSFDPSAALTAAAEPEPAVEQAAVVAEEAPAPAPSGKSKKKGAKKEEPEDLDALLEEFGVAQAAGSKSKKKGGKK